MEKTSILKSFHMVSVYMIEFSTTMIPCTRKSEPANEIYAENRLSVDK